MLSRRDIRLPQVQYMLDNGCLPISVDFRLVPEINVRDGAMTDVCDALSWIQEQLPSLKLNRPGIRVGKKIIVVGWSAGGTLAMTIPASAMKRGIRPPDAVLALYCPTDFESDFWRRSNFPEKSEQASKADYDLLEGVFDRPVTEYKIPKEKLNVGGWMNLEDPRSRIVLHMNWQGQMPAILLNGLPTKGSCKTSTDQYELPRPSAGDIESISPASQIRKGEYTVPTFLIHGKRRLDNTCQIEYCVLTGFKCRHTGRLDSLAAVAANIY